LRLHRLVLLALGAAAVARVLRRRRSVEFVDVHFEDGSSVRLARGTEARDLLDDAHAILETAR
jgi:hypothetical protein